MSPETKGRLTWILIIVSFFAIIGISTCGDSWYYTQHGEHFNKVVFIPLAVIAVGLLGYFSYKNMKK